jgi:hypothetical protein
MFETATERDERGEAAWASFIVLILSDNNHHGGMRYLNVVFYYLVYARLLIREGIECRLSSQKSPYHPLLLQDCLK